MTVIVSDNGFAPESFDGHLVAFADLQSGEAKIAANEAALVDVPNDVTAAQVLELAADAAMIRIDFPSFADGRGFSIARQLRMRGYAGVLRAKGDLIADQYRAARRVGFDEVEISDALAARQPADQWPLGKTGAELGYQRKFQSAVAAS